MTESAHNPSDLLQELEDQLMEEEQVRLPQELETALLEDATVRDAFSQMLDQSETTSATLSEGRLADGTRLGGYVIDSFLGEGGMGHVYKAHHATDDALVAIKLVKTNDWEMVKRFERERRILARFRHPRISCFLDCGSLPDGRPWVAMEYVSGRPITEWCNTQGLKTDERVALFLQICDALAYTHRALVLHQDLKPANILVTEDGVPMLLDFGIAALLDDARDERTTDNMGFSKILTPEYASPEQLDGKSLNASSDIYTLGLILYELLAGEPPYDVPTTPTMRVGQYVREAKVIKPGARAKANNRKADISTDLDSIVLKAMALEPEQRYSSVEALASDLQRYLDGKPITVRAASPVYRLQKFVQRNLLPVALVAAFCVALFSFTLMLSHQAGVAEAASLRAEQERETADAVSQFMISLFNVADPGTSTESQLDAMAILDGGVKAIDGLGEHPELQTSLRGLLGQLFFRLGAFDRAGPLLEQAYEEQAQQNPESKEMLEVVLALVEYRHGTGQLEGLQDIARENMDRAQRLGSDAVFCHTISLYCSVSFTVGQRQHALDLLWEHKDLAEKTFGKVSADFGTWLNDIGVMQLLANNLDGTEAILRESVRIRKEVLGPTHSYTSFTEANLTLLLTRRGKLDEAERLLRRTLATIRERFDKHQIIAGQLVTLGHLMYAKGDFEEAQKLLEESLAHGQDFYDETSPRATMSSILLARTEFELGKEEGKKRMRRVLSRLGPDTSPWLRRNALIHQAEMYIRESEYDSARKLLSEAEAIALPEDRHTEQLALYFSQVKLMLIYGEWGAARKLVESRADDPMFETLLIPSYQQELLQAVTRGVNNRSDAYEKVALDRIEKVSAILPDYAPTMQWSIFIMAAYYDARDMHADATAWRKRLRY